MSGTLGTVYEIPTTNYPRRFNITLGSTEYRLTFTWQDAPSAGWVMDIDDASGNHIVGSIPLVTGADLLAQYGYLGFGVKMSVQTDGDPLAAPTFDNLGSSAHLYMVVTQ